MAELRAAAVTPELIEHGELKAEDKTAVTELAKQTATAVMSRLMFSLLLLEQLLLGLVVQDVFHENIIPRKLVCNATHWWKHIHQNYFWKK